MMWSKFKSVSQNESKRWANLLSIWNCGERNSAKWLPQECRIFAMVLLTNSMEQSLSWEADIRSASQGISRLSFNAKVHYNVRKSPPLSPILTQSTFSHPISLRSHLILGIFYLRHRALRPTQPSI
jgi:hypothetical protein